MKRLVMLLLTAALTVSAARSSHALDLWPFNNGETRPEYVKSAWVKRLPPRPEPPSVLDKFATGTKKFWHNSTDWITPDPKPRARREPSFWDSLFGQPKDPGPQTVVEWMSQPRLDP
jgi:hypothetical protein